MSIERSLAGLVVDSAQPERVRRLPRGRHVAGLIEALRAAVRAYALASHCGRVAASRRAADVTKILHRQEQARRARR